MRRQRGLWYFGQLVWFAAALLVLIIGHAAGSKSQNTTTVGRVAISCREEEEQLALSRKGILGAVKMQEKEKVSYHYLEPGEVFWKRAQIIVEEGSYAAWLRAKLLMRGGTAAQQKDLRENMEAQGAWYYREEDGYFYFQKPVQEGECAELCVSIRVPEKWTGMEQPFCFCLYVNAEAAEDGCVQPVRKDDRVVGWQWMEEGEFETYK